MAVMWACSSSDEGAAPMTPATSTPPDAGTATTSSSSSSGGDASPDAGSPSADPCASSPALPSERPSAANTGVPPGVALAPSGDIEAETAGMVISGKDVTGQILVRADNVTIENSKVHTKGGENDIAVKIEDGVKGTKVLHSEIYTETGGYVGLLGGDAFVCASYFHGWENGMTLGGGMMVQANFIEKLASGQAGAHYDGIEVYSGGAPSKLWGNHIRMTDPADHWLDETGAINLTAYQGDIDDVEMNGNLLGGGSYTLYVDEQNASKATNVKITNNTFYKGTPAYGPVLIRREASVTVFSGNTLEDGTAVDR
jgi:hypothetical protein